MRWAIIFACFAVYDFAMMIRGPTGVFPEWLFGAAGIFSVAMAVLEYRRRKA